MTETELRQKVDAAYKQVPFGTIWRHRNGTVYVVSGLAIIEATCEVGILYRREMGNLTLPVIWVRPLSEFLDGRFTRVEGEA